jgi:prepilin-type N-terminal cleavage/methylation domain-containing protein
VRPRRGFTLVESLAALAILGIALVLSFSLLGRGPRAGDRLAAHRAALRAAEAALEAVRARALPLEPGPVALPGAGPAGPRVRLDVKTAGRPGLFEVVATATAEAPGRPVRLSVTTLFWRPG